MKIGFFGDSFCQEITNMHTRLNGYETYIKQLKKYYYADVVNLGVGGSSIWDVILNQFPQFSNNVPDVCIFVWTDYGRLYHPTVHNLGPWNLQDKKKTLAEFHYTDLFNRKERAASSEYYKFLYDDKKAEQEAISALYYFDRHILSQLAEKTKIIHLWSFGKYKDSSISDKNHPSNINYIYRFTTGVECRPPLRYFSVLNKPDGYDYSLDANHIYGNENNELVSNMIIDAIDNYSNGKLQEYNL